ncbi:MAG: winged helix-turn-helix transcriptional regulator [Saprospiraceae bacterium]|nr:winged helix-turn-helix transcriptional regulator [Saprospiraceae bacterium]
MSAQKTEQDQHVEVVLRKIGHEILLNANDSTSRILPIEKDNDRYKIRFDSNFGFIPDSLVQTVNAIMDDTELSESYIIELVECDSNLVVYSFERGIKKNIDVGTCMMRSLPTDCYAMFVTLVDVNDPFKAKQKVHLSNSIISGLLLLLAGLFIVVWSSTRKTVIDPHIIRLGSYKFDKRNMHLVHKNERTELTNKETDLLNLLYGSANATVERDIILQRVWGDEGDYIGRTLDVFISKLRKKLDGDDKIKIVNIRGVGYKLVVN